MNKIKLNNLEISQEDLINEITGNKELMDTLKAKFENKNTGWFVPKEGEEYWYLGSNEVYYSHYNTNIYNKDVIECQQVFRTKEEAKKADEQRKAKVRILKRIAEENAKEGWVCDWENGDQIKCILHYNYTDNNLTYSYNFCQAAETGFYMSETVAKKLKSELLEDYKIYLGVK